MYGIKPSKLNKATSKQIYTEHTMHDISEPKVTNAFLHVNFPADVWPRLSYSSLTAGQRQAVYDSVHGLIRNWARLFEQGRVLDESCLDCPRTIPLRPARQNIKHIFRTCVKVRDAWRYVRGLVDCHQPKLQGEEDGRLVRFLFLRDRMDKEIGKLPTHSTRAVR